MPTAQFFSRALTIVSFCIACCSSHRSHAAQSIEIYAYHNAPPFLVNTDTNTGLNQDLVHALQTRVGPDYVLSLRPTSRPDINQRLAKNLPTIVLWTHPSWFGSKANSYLWAAPLFSDRDVLVSLVSEKRQPFPLKGSRLGGIAGYSYPGLNELVNTQQLTRVDADSDKENLLKLADKQVDVIVITRSSFWYYAKQPQFVGKFHVVGQPYDTYHRQVLVTSHYQAFLPVLNQALADLEKSPSWQERLALYGLKAD